MVGDSILLEFSPRDAVEADLLRARVGEGDQGSVIQITNGNDEVWTLDYEILPSGGGGARHNTEANWLLGGLTGERRPDLAGTTITHVLLIVDDATVDTPGDDPNGDGMWTDYDLDVRMVVFGQP